MRKTVAIIATIAAVIAIPAGCATQKKSLTDRLRISPETHIASGKMLEAQQNFAGAEAQYQAAIESQPELTVAYHRLADLYLRLGRIDEAGRVLRIAIQAGADEASLRNNLGFTLMRMGRYDEAEQMLAAALAISPTFHRARMNLALVHARAGRVDESIAEFEKIVPREDALYNVALIRMQQRDYLTAAWAFGETLRIKPNYADAQMRFDKAVFLAQHAPQKQPNESLLAAISRPVEPAPVQTTTYQPPVEPVVETPAPRPAPRTRIEPPAPAAPTRAVVVAAPIASPPAPVMMRDISRTVQTSLASAAVPKNEPVEPCESDKPEIESKPTSTTTPPPQEATVSTTIVGRMSARTSSTDAGPVTPHIQRMMPVNE